MMFIVAVQHLKCIWNATILRFDSDKDKTWQNIPFSTPSLQSSALQLLSYIDVKLVLSAALES